MRKYKGFTLIETLIVAVLVSFVGLGVVLVVAHSNRILNDSARQAFYYSHLNYILDEISKDIKSGYLLTLPTTYSENIKITQRIGGVDRIIEWGFKEMLSDDYNGVFPFRRVDGVETVYKIIGLNNENYKEMKTYFTFPSDVAGTFKPGKFFGVNVIVEGNFYIGERSDWKNRVQNTVYCRIENDGVF